MDHRILQIQNHPLFLSNRNKLKVPEQPSVTFKESLQQETNLKISKHAQKRLDERNIRIQESKWEEIQGKISEAKTKGIHDSLVVMGDAALIVNVTNNTVITAMNRQEANSQIFTNINGTILLD
ncbi:TIGR02530 family flagellar biosynthesis protein [Fredinandcohnia quinoae]|uniref:Flagellar protein n=1 Tax=Fredinandcohnia quinoae TaxID=2918902 RepID=A0AAW5DZC7_9BACI|nr:TIGR02530 family flagellar biosynthesis protein [Fredinandcohnia sp. SECRCQ15]MCH1623779.1 flagellar protein [Fredinandcohnia sp. SECRCQ15]